MGQRGQDVTVLVAKGTIWGARFSLIRHVFNSMMHGMKALDAGDTELDIVWWRGVASRPFSAFRPYDTKCRPFYFWNTLHSPEFAIFSLPSSIRHGSTHYSRSYLAAAYQRDTNQARNFV